MQGLILKVYFVLKFNQIPFYIAFQMTKAGVLEVLNSSLNICVDLYGCITKGDLLKRFLEKNLHPLIISSKGFCPLVEQEQYLQGVAKIVFWGFHIHLNLQDDWQLSENFSCPPRQNFCTFVI